MDGHLAQLRILNGMDKDGDDEGDEKEVAGEALAGQDLGGTCKSRVKSRAGGDVGPSGRLLICRTFFRRPLSLSTTYFHLPVVGLALAVFTVGKSRGQPRMDPSLQISRQS